MFCSFIKDQSSGQKALAQWIRARVGIGRGGDHGSNPSGDKITYLLKKKD